MAPTTISCGLDRSELVIEVGPLAIFRSSSLEYGEKRGEVPNIRRCYTVAVNPNWLDDGGEVQLCIAGNVRIAGTDVELEAASNPLVQILKVDGQHHVLLLTDDGRHESKLQLESTTENNAKAN